MHNKCVKNLGLLIGLLAGVSGCFYYPKQVQFYDEQCAIVAKKMVLSETGLGYGRIQCINEGCLIALIPVAASAIVAGSIVVTGNAIYWLEKQGRCERQPNPPPPSEDSA